jgi:hypothetical protein
MMKVVALLGFLIAGASAISLDGSTFEDAVAGKAAFIKFQAPW